MEDFYDMHVGLYNPGDFGGSKAAPGPACDHKFRILRAPPRTHSRVNASCSPHLRRGWLLYRMALLRP